MKPIIYSDGQVVQLGDFIEITKRKYLFWREIHTGEVTYVYDSRKPIQREINDFGTNIEVKAGGFHMWCDTEILSNNLALVARA